ncbi:TonB-dependent receptor [Aureibaculum sp. 2210JD6-5]|uniref:SusC/RagA family TonB-linked outer membrane protein n=1 Tax=Aureibaculum sp. 2210JD6-5 TaxID=3103957 RepID=UPI002AAEB8E0|nr:TonB-dependent receptor [Aureibaculum sp. 2210JD6-5]MDY7396806.1 TonB-dependent receptor [Aureibaculum sp. 2210JD6-5]
MKKNLFKLLVILLFPAMVMAQQSITGVVTDKDGMALPGASVVEKGTTNGVVTDFDGNYSITLKGEQSTLIFSFIGYDSQEIAVGDKTTINVSLSEDAQQLNEVVVIGYGTVNKKDLTGAVTSIKPTEEAVEQSRGIEDVIKGRSAGVQVSSNGAEPGASASIKIRGLSSLTSNSEPLYVVDGIIMDSATEDTTNPLSGYTPPQGGGISGISPSDIESIEILKDASATAIYGSRAANGVIIVTTKRGIKGKAKFNFTTSLSTGSVTRNIEVLDTEGYANYQNDMRSALGQDLAYNINSNGTIFTTGDDPVEITGINWADDTYRNSIIQKNRLSVSGGGENGNYYISGGTVSNQGTFPNALAKSVDFNLKVNQDLTDRVNISTKIAATYTELNSSKGTDENGGANNSMVRQVILAAPIVNFAENNQDADDVDESIDGPRAWTSDYDDDAQEIRLLGSLNMDYKISKAFTYRLRFGGDYRKKERSFWYGNALLKGKNPNGLAGLGTLNRFRYNIDNTLMFKKRFNKNSRINATIGALYDKTSIKTTRYSAADFADKSLRADGISFGAINTPLVIDSEFPTIVSFIARMNYTLYNRYLFTGTFRADGSSKFSKGNQWGYFPAFSFAWKVKEESFLRDSKTISDLKIRLGYGEVGNQNIPPYSYLTPFGATEAALADASGGNLIAVVPLNLANPDLKWETSIQYNGGIDFGFFNSRLTGTVDAYYKTSSDLLLNVALGPTAGFDFITANQGDIENKGLEFSLNGDIISKEKVRWNVFGNVSFNRNNIRDLGDVLPAEFGALGQQTAFTGTQVSGGTFFKQPANIFIKGREAGLFYGLETNGIIRNDGQLTSTPSGDPLKYKGTDLSVGDVFFVDQNGDGDITDADKTIIGNPNPDFTFGFGSSFDYGNLSLSLMFNGVYGNDIANGNIFETGYANNTQKNIRAIAYEDAFNATSNPDGNYPNVGVGGYGTNYTTEFNDRAVEDGSFLRLSYVTLGYDIPVKGTNFFDSVKLSVSGQNLWLLTDYSGFDPEVNSFAYDPTRTGIDWGSFPNQKSFTVGLNVTF